MTLRKATRSDIPAIASFMQEELAKPPFQAHEQRSSILASLRFYLHAGEAWVNVEHARINGVLIYKVERFWEGNAIIMENVVAKNNQPHIELALLKKMDSISRTKQAEVVSFITDVRARRKSFTGMGYKLRKDLVILEKKIR